MSYNAPKTLPAGDKVKLDQFQNYRPKHVELIEIINKIIIVASSWLFILLLLLFLYCLVFPLFCPSPVYDTCTDLLFLYTQRRRSPLTLEVLVSSGFRNIMCIDSYFVTYWYLNSFYGALFTSKSAP